jgi:signal transduction histidine kinase
MSEASIPAENVPDVTFQQLVKFIRQVTHDVRNGLNAIDLQAAFVGELAVDGEVAEEAAKLRKMVAHVTADMQELTSRFAEIRPVLMECPVDEFMHSFREAVNEEFGSQAKRLVWEAKTGMEEVEMDYTLLSRALMELVRNAIYFREGEQAIHFTVWNEGAKVVFEVRQNRSRPEMDLDDWGRAPLTSSRRGGYGLGSFYVRRILDTIRGELDIGYDGSSNELRARLSLPMKKQARPGS